MADEVLADILKNMGPLPAVDPRDDLLSEVERALSLHIQNAGLSPAEELLLLSRMQHRATEFVVGGLVRFQRKQPP
jgi:hypothetical protein